MLKIAQYIIAGFLIWTFVPVIEDIALCIARFFFRVGDVLHLIPDIF